jgi:23S rRNA pseudouridine2604 synthase
MKTNPIKIARPEYPMRINKYLAHKGYSTRKGADELIESNKVFINGVRAVLGDKVLETDTVEVKSSKKPTSYIYYAYNKPRGVITHSAQGREKEIKEIFPIKDVFPVGRLDKDSHGLIILTNDGRITDRLLNPVHTHEKEYVVELDKSINSRFKFLMEKGVLIEGYTTKECQVILVNENSFRIIITEGKKHQIRRMCAALGYQIKSLKRTRVMNIELSKLKPGEHRELKGVELEEFLKKLGL